MKKKRFSEEQVNRGGHGFAVYPIEPVEMVNGQDEKGRGGEIKLPTG
jgi:hypothetical protein